MRISRRSSKMTEIRSDETRRKKSGHFAIISFILDIIAFACVFGGLWLVFYGASSDAWITLTVFALFPLGIGLMLLIGTLVLFGWSLVMVITQFAINRSAWSWVALAVLIVTFVGAVITALLILNGLQI